MHGLQFEVTHPHGRSETTLVLADRIVLGSGAHCDVRVAVDQAAFEHIVFTRHATGFRIENIAAEAPASLDGAPFRFADMAGPITITVHSTTVRVSLAEPRSVTRPKVAAAGLLRIGIALAGVICAFVFLARDEQDTSPHVQAPILFGEGGSAMCPRSDPREANVLGHDARVAAEGARERSPFAPAEGVTAVRAYEQAASCFRVSGAREQANEMTRMADELREQVTREYRARQVRLDYLLSTKDHDLAKRDAIALRALLGERGGAYATWLSIVQRELAAGAPIER